MQIRSNPVTIFFIILLIVLSTMAGCSSVHHDTSPSVDVVKTSSTVDFHDSIGVKSRILKQYDEWHKTPYQIGGLSKRGIDCSGFVYITFRSKLGCNIPRTTELQVKTGRKIARNNLRAGDLVFFQTSFFYSHVGIYLGDSKFLHVSSSRGVTISSLNENYWKKCYWTARRICS